MIKLSLRMQITDVINLRRPKINIIDLTADGTVSATHHSLSQQVAWYLDFNCLNLLVLFSRQLLKHRSLCRSARKTVKNIAVFAIVLSSSLSNNPNSQVIGH